MNSYMPGLRDWLEAARRDAAWLQGYTTTNGGMGVNAHGAVATSRRTFIRRHADDLVAALNAMDECIRGMVKEEKQK